MNTLVVVIVSAVILGVLFWKADRPLAVILAIAYLLRLMVMYADYYHLFPNPFSGVDTEYFHRFTLAYLHDDGPPLTNYTYVLAFFYTVFGESGRFMAQFINVLLSFGVLPLFYATLRQLDMSRKRRLFVLSVLAFMPIVLSLSGILLREAWILFFLTLSLFFFIRWYQRGNPVNAFFCLAAVLTTMTMHAGVLSLYLVYVVAFLTCRTWKMEGTWRYLAVIGVILLSVFVLYEFPGILLDKFSSSIAHILRARGNGVEATAVAATEVVDIQPVVAGSSYLVWMKGLSLPLRLLLMPLKMFYMLFSPLPMDWRNATDAFVFFVDSSVYIALIVLMLSRPLRGKGFQLKRLLICMTFMMTLLFSWGTSNAGTAVRHRSKFLPVMLIAAYSRNPVRQVRRIPETDGVGADDETDGQTDGLAQKKFFFVTTIYRSLHFFEGQYELLQKDFDLTAIASKGSDLEEFGASHGVKVYGIPMEREISPWKDLVSLFRFIRFFRKERPYIVHGNTPKGALLSMMAACLTDVPVRIYMCHGLRYQGLTGFKRRLLMMTERITCTCATHVMSVSKGVAKDLVADQITHKNVVVVWNGSVKGIDAARFNPEKEFNREELRRLYGLTPSDYVLTFVGRIVRDKGVNELVEAFSKLHASHPEMRLLMAGRVEQEGNPASDETLQVIENNPAIIAPGMQKNIPEILAITNIFILPSYREGFGLSLMEAGAMGVPAIATDITGCNEVIEDGKTGLLIPPRSVSAIVEAVERLYSDTELYQSMKENCRSYIVGRYEQSELWEKYHQYYKNIQPVD